MDTPPTPRKALFQNQKVLPAKPVQPARKSGLEKLDLLHNKAKIEFENDLENSLKSLEKEFHLKRLENLRQLADKLKDDSWMYPDLETELGEIIGKTMSSCDPVVLSYENSLLRQSDVELLTPPNWLNDNIIAFWFEYLEYDLYKANKDTLGFVCPQTVQYLKFGTPEDVKSTIEGLELEKKDYVLFPVNNCREQTVPGGTHWSLLLYRSSDDLFEHYDSYPGSCNFPVAESLARILAAFLRGPTRGQNNGVRLREVPCTHQGNTYDCGMHVILNAEGLCRKFVGGDQRALTDIVPTSAVHGARETLRDIIYSLRK